MGYRILRFIRAVPGEHILIIVDDYVGQFTLLALLYLAVGIPEFAAHVLLCISYNHFIYFFLYLDKSYHSLIALICHFYLLCYFCVRRCFYLKRLRQ